jgi:hypothetical protein
MNAFFAVDGAGIAVRSTVLPSPITRSTPKANPAVRMTVEAITISLNRVFRQHPTRAGPDFAAALGSASFFPGVRCPPARGPVCS